MVLRVYGHVDIPFVGFEKLEVEAGGEGGNAHVEFCVCETGLAGRRGCQSEFSGLGDEGVSQ